MRTVLDDPVDELNDFVLIELCSRHVINIKMRIIGFIEDIDNRFIPKTGRKNNTEEYEGSWYSRGKTCYWDIPHSGISPITIFPKRAGPVLAVVEVRSLFYGGKCSDTIQLPIRNGFMYKILADIVTQ